MVSRYKNILIGLILSLSLALGACSDENASAKVNLDSYPEVVQSGEISVGYYDQSLYLSNISEEVFTKLGDLFQDLDKETKIAYKKELGEYNRTLSKHKLKPKTKTDKELNEIANRILDEQLMAIGEAIRYLDTDNTDDLQSVHKRMKVIMDSSLEFDLLKEGF